MEKESSSCFFIHAIRRIRGSSLLVLGGLAADYIVDAVGDKKVALRVGCDGGGDGKRAAWGCIQGNGREIGHLAARGNLVQSVGVGHINETQAIDRDSFGIGETNIKGRGLSGGRNFADGIIGGVGDKDVAGGINGQAVRVTEARGGGNTIGFSE
jgi:hypothetical protein